ncbi:uncharacterized protein J7T54_006892 [Emericellopsis cladophorae]|uniref:R3H-associated N-terminal domain-containing protein n=1 Tax=Emericellopsis cladophorae TaxID=2686198 RepID=A0A9P9Y939_9HYPO|nr:uncharacterized protein J7T54_006892 [Emericellopsis cladophorae]KAI6785250.1 hypothetical protein J7T54_006892 [Emericellopsis cladophorae]
MALYNAVPPPPELASTSTPPPPSSATAAPRAAPTTPLRTQTSATGIDIDAWTVSALQALSVSPVARGTGTPLSISLDAKAAAAADKAVKFQEGHAEADTPRRPLSRRDSLKRREALLKGNEGSRQRRRWENDRLVGVPNAQPPLESDWAPRATYPTRNVPYALANFWDMGLRQRQDDEAMQRLLQRKAKQVSAGRATGTRKGEVSRDLRETVKRSPIVKTWVRGLEEPVRDYLRGECEQDTDSEDEEIVFVGRRGAEEKNGGSRWRMANRNVQKEMVEQGMVFDDFGDGEGASFKRWLTHSISDYYGLESRSVVLTNPSRKVVYVGLKKVQQRDGLSMKHFPRPMWELC